MTASLESVLGSKEASLALLQVLADNSFDAVLITDASLEGKITYATRPSRGLRVTIHRMLSERPRVFLRGRVQTRKSSSALLAP